MVLYGQKVETYGPRHWDGTLRPVSATYVRRTQFTPEWGDLRLLSCPLTDPFRRASLVCPSTTQTRTFLRILKQLTVPTPLSVPL